MKRMRTIIGAFSPPWLLLLLLSLLTMGHFVSGHGRPTKLPPMLDAMMVLESAPKINNYNVSVVMETKPVPPTNPMPLTDHSLFRMIHLLRYLNPKLLAKDYQTAMRGKASWLTCELCSVTVSAIRLYPSLYTVQRLFINLCAIGYEEYRVCQGLSELFGKEIIYILTNSPLTAAEVCGVAISRNCMPSGADYPYGEKWSTQLLPLAPEVQLMLDGLAERQHRKPDNGNDVKNVSAILHLSDLHLDMYYQVDAPAGCGEPLCCRSTSGHSHRSQKAGYWGSFQNCDSVLRTVENLLATITRQYSDHYRVALLTGDYLPHDVWNTSRQEIQHTTRMFNQLVRRHIPKDKIIIPVIGNHESSPVDQFCPSTINEEFSTQWLYEELLNQWKDWIPAEYHETFRNYGYYSVHDGMARYIVLNTNYCARLNFWNVLRYTDMGGMLRWLQLELQNATAAGQHVYIVGHIAPDDHECATHWVVAYRKIIQLFQPVIRGQFFGHTHMDEYRLYYTDGKDPRPIGVAYLAPSVTTYLDVMPAFRFYSTDPDSGAIQDHQTYYMNITKANDMAADSTPTWEFEYSARDSYQISTALTPDAWHNFTTAAMAHPELLRRYYKHYRRLSDAESEEKSYSFMADILVRTIVRGNY